jgi:23S rRNA (cytidine2498-2'-O)-methyltransferase
MNPRFYFATCQVGAEKAVKSEVLAEFPHVRFAFSRPGFITFKEEDDRQPLIKHTQGIFTRLWGTNIGQAKDEASLVKLMAEIPEGSVVHAFERDTFVPGDDPEAFQPNARINALVQKLKAEHPAFQKFQWNAKPKDKTFVYDLIWIDDFHVQLGKHVHADYIDPAPGNQPVIALPANSPSRAYLKIEEAIHRFKPEIRPGMQVLEVGCSPGGASTAMLSRGMKVTGVDPKRMHESVYKNPNFTSIQRMAKDVSEADLNSVNPEWIVMDMNIAPLEAIDELAHVIRCLKKNLGRSLSLRLGLLTIKLNDWKFAESIPLYMKRLEEIGFHNMVAIHLGSNRQEYFVYADFA